MPGEGQFITPVRVIGGGGGGVGITGTDNNAVAPLQVTLLSINETYVFDGTNWIRLQGGVHDAAAPASPQAAFIAGIARTALPALANGDVAIPTFDLSGRLQTTLSPGTVITSPADTAVAPAATVALTVPPVGTTRMTVEVTDGDATTRIRVREVGGAAGAGRLLTLLGSTTFGGPGGAVAALEVENVAGPASAVSISFEG